MARCSMPPSCQRSCCPAWPPASRPAQAQRRRRRGTAAPSSVERAWVGVISGLIYPHHLLAALLQALQGVVLALDCLHIPLLVYLDRALQHGCHRASQDGVRRRQRGRQRAARWHAGWRLPLGAMLWPVVRAAVAASSAACCGSECGGDEQRRRRPSPACLLTCSCVPSSSTWYTSLNCPSPIFFSTCHRPCSPSITSPGLRSGGIARAADVVLVAAAQAIIAASLRGWPIAGLGKWDGCLYNSCTDTGAFRIAWGTEATRTGVASTITCTTRTNDHPGAASAMIVSALDCLEAKALAAGRSEVPERSGSFTGCQPSQALGAALGRPPVGSAAAAARWVP